MARQINKRTWFFAVLLPLIFFCSIVQSAEIAKADVYSVVELTFEGPMQNPKDVPAGDIDFRVLFRHKNGSPEYKIHGFWDGDGKGGTAGSVFKIRFCPNKPGRWDLVEVYLNKQELNSQKQDQYVTAVASDNPGFWIADPDSPGRRWYMRSDGSHQYIFGKTHYTFLSGYQSGDKTSGNDIADDNLKYLRETIDRDVTFWKMSPDTGVFANLHRDFRGLAWSGHEYVLGTNEAHENIVANLPGGTWMIKRYDIIGKEEKTLSKAARGSFTFNAPDSRAVMFHFKKIDEGK